MIKYSDPDNTGAGKVMSFIAGDSTRMVISGSTGYVGIGTTSPDVPLVISGGTAMTGGWGRTLTLEHNFPVLALRSENATDAWGGIGYDNSTGMKFFVNSSDVDIPTNGTLGLTILDSGNVGIGNAGSSPSNVLTVQDSGGSGLVKIYSTTGAVTNGQAVLEVRADDTSSPSSYNLIDLNVGGTTKFKVDGDGTTTHTATTLTLSGQGASSLNIGSEESGNKRITLNGGGSNDSAIEFRNNAVSRTDLGCFGGSANFVIKMYDGGMTDRLSITPGGTFTGSGTNDISDRDLKKNINPISNGLETINKLQGRTFEWKESTKMDGGIKYGLIAQELEEVLPDLVWDKSGLSKKEDGSYHKSIHISGVIPVLIEAVKELSEQNKVLEKRIEELEN
jgi:hypothetical protein